jgi:CubicO group peptidase (beta-lactamase class C family)
MRTVRLAGVAAALLLLTAGAVGAQAPAVGVARSSASAAPTVHGVSEARQPASRRLLNSWLAAFNSGDRRRYDAFLRTHYPARVQFLDYELRFSEWTGGFDLRRVDRVTATRVSGWVEERDWDQPARFELTVSARKPQRIVSFALMALAPPREFSIARLPEGEALARADALMRKKAAQDWFSGAALVAKDGEIVFSKAYGLADRGKAIANTVDTRFRIGSMNKMFTAVATLQLVEAGKLGLEDPIGKHLRGYPNADVASKVTVRHLLMHTGGTGDIFGPDFELNRLSLREHGDYVALYGARNPRFEPGSQFEYSNYGFVLLGAVIEAVSGTSYYEYVREHVFAPAGMTSTDSSPESEDVPDRSVGYTSSGPRAWQPNNDTLPWRGTAAGGGYSTVGDLARFSQALTSYRLLGRAATELLITGKVNLAPGIKYALGFDDLRDADGNGSVGHAGGARGMNGDLRINLKSGYVVAVLANMDPPVAQRIASYLDQRLPASGPP